MNKTPITILQEMMSRQSKTPNYELVHNGGGTHVNTFIYQVSCDGFTATGCGRCKKSAKHEAAKAMLEKIAKHNSLPQLPASPAQSPVKTPLPIEPPVCPRSPANEPFINAVGALQDLCQTNNLGDPQYKETGVVGPAHARVFTMQCIVTTFKEEGTATTKKQAKHEAARNMIIRITDFISDETNPSVRVFMDKENEEKSTKAALDKYTEMNKKNEVSKLKVNWGLKIINYHKSLKESFILDAVKLEFLDKLENLLVLIQQYKENADNELFAQIYKDFESMLELMDIKYYENSLDNTDKKFTFYKGIRLNTAPDIYEIGKGVTDEQASICALNAVLDSVKFLLQ